MLATRITPGVMFNMEWGTVILTSFIVVAGVAGVIFYLKKREKQSLSSSVEEAISKAFPKALSEATDHLVKMADQKLRAEKQDIKTDLGNKKELFEELVKRLHQELQNANKDLLKAEKDRIGSFGALKQELKSNQEMIGQLKTTTESLRKVLDNNQLRGQFGEQVAEDLLKMSGFVRGVDYAFNKEQKGSETRPDFTIYLPNKVKINVDSKFPYSNLQKTIEAGSAGEKKEYLKKFQRDIKAKVKQVTSRDYINPDDNTVDFVILFIPNEMIFSYIYDKMNDLWSEAMREKVVFAGPFSFTATLRLVRQAYDNFKYQKNIRQIITNIKNFEKEFGKYNEEFKKVGERITQLSNQFEKVNTTRTTQLLRTIDKVKLEEGKEQPPLLE
jgi:DNA recombination protein RmuC